MEINGIFRLARAIYSAIFGYFAYLCGKKYEKYVLVALNCLKIPLSKKLFAQQIVKNTNKTQKTQRIGVPAIKQI